MKLWIGGDSECEVYILTDDDAKPMVNDMKTPLKQIVDLSLPMVLFPDDMKSKDVSEQDAAVLVKFIDYVHDQRKKK